MANWKLHIKYHSYLRKVQHNYISSPFDCSKEGMAPRNTSGQMLYMLQVMVSHDQGWSMWLDTWLDEIASPAAYLAFLFHWTIKVWWDNFCSWWVATVANICPSPVIHKQIDNVWLLGLLGISDFWCSLLCTDLFNNPLQSIVPSQALQTVLFIIHMLVSG